VTPLLALERVRVRYGAADVLDVPALAVHGGETLAVVGPNGSGKSTLLRVLGLLETPAEGVVRWHGRPVAAPRALAERRRMASVFQQPLLARGSVAANVGIGLRFRGVDGTTVAARVARWLERFGIAHLAGRPARRLSGGEAQRVALARALVLEPELLLLDEPFAALDATARAALIPELGAILRTEAVTTVLVTHDRAEAQALADRVAVLLGGRIRQLDHAARVFWAPSSEEVARFVGVETLVDGHVESVDEGLATVAVGHRRLEVAASVAVGDRVRVAIRPEDVTLLRGGDPAGATSARNHLPGVVTAVTPSSPYVRVIVDCGFPLVAALTARSLGELGLLPGVPVTAVFKASAAHLIPYPGPAPTRDNGFDTPQGAGL
jgi:tungstate transport system ATP-binding protein